MNRRLFLISPLILMAVPKTRRPNLRHLGKTANFGTQVMGSGRPYNLPKGVLAKHYSELRIVFPKRSAC